MPYVPYTGIKYPDRPDEHITIPKKLAPDYVLDEDFPYIDNSLSFKIRRALLHFAIFTLAFLVLPIRFALRIEGRGNLRKYRKALKGGCIIISNHVHRWGLLCILQALRYRTLYYPAWSDNFHGADRNLIRLTGGIPIPKNARAMRAFTKAFDELNKKKKWILVHPETSCWLYYQPIRPFKRGAFAFAQRYDIPVLPIAFSYRPARGVYKLFKGKGGEANPLLTLRIGEPMFPDQSLPRRECVIELRKRCHARVCELSGITSNPYPPEGD